MDEARTQKIAYVAGVITSKVVVSPYERAGRFCRAREGLTVVSSHRSLMIQANGVG